MRRALIPITLATTALSACGGQQSSETQEVELPAAAYDVASNASSEAAPATRAGRAGGPDVSVTAAPGVAFNYRYAFRLASDRISEVQEQHARTCEELGVARCRITGMSYRLVNERDVTARLDFKLEPSLARRFGRAGLEAVNRAEGILILSEITGEDVGTRIAANTRSIAQLQEDLRRLEQQIADQGVAGSLKDGLRAEAERIRAQIRGIEANRGEQQESLATTPMTFEYGSGNYGSDRPDFAEAASRAWDGLLWGLYGLFVTMSVLLPWLLALWLLFLFGRAVRKRFPRREMVATNDSVV